MADACASEARGLSPCGFESRRPDQTRLQDVMGGTMDTHEVRAATARQIALAGEFLARNAEALTADLEENHIELGGPSISINLESPTAPPLVSVGKTFILLDGGMRRR